MLWNMVSITFTDLKFGVEHQCWCWCRVKCWCRCWVLNSLPFTTRSTSNLKSIHLPPTQHQHHHLKSLTVKWVGCFQCVWFEPLHWNKSKLSLMYFLEYRNICMTWFIIHEHIQGNNYEIVEWIDNCNFFSHLQILSKEATSHSCVSR